MMARLESGEVLLTARMSDVFLRFRQTVLPGNVAFAELHAKGVLIQARQACGLGEGEPAPRVVSAGQFDLHVPLPLPRPQGKAGQEVLAEIEGDAPAMNLAGTDRAVKAAATGYRLRPSDSRLLQETPFGRTNEINTTTQGHEKTGLRLQSRCLLPCHWTVTQSSPPYPKFPFEFLSCI